MLEKVSNTGHWNEHGVIWGRERKLLDGNGTELESIIVAKLPQNTSVSVISHDRKSV